ncbi:MAG: C_GCAxxG_C_C family protein [Clostridia bacterium]|nr:C_GCAxxG_C_C family protein [Clostridia bacterium]MBQ3076556.1 C_GCAxxG_C_C family protein [Clostridia bacterium]
MSNRHFEEAASMRRAGVSCGQCTTLPYAEEFGLDRAKLSAMTMALGGGFSRGSVCGCVSGASLLLGLKFGQEDGPEAKQKVTAAVRALGEAVEQRFGSVDCTGILGVNAQTPEGRAKFNELGLRERICIPVMEFCIDFVDSREA